jgi:hypothetical protein
MRFAIRLVLAFVGAAAVVATAPAVFASAAPVQHSRNAPVAVRGDRLAVAIPLTPGRHAVSEAVSLNSRSYSGQATSAASPQVQVRVGKNNCGGFNGEVLTGNTPFPYNSGWVQVYGIVWDDCGAYTYPTTVYVYVSYDCFACGNPVNYSVGNVSSSGPGDVSTSLDSGQQDTPSGFDASGIKVTACLKWNAGWACGKGQGV